MKTKIFFIVALLGFFSYFNSQTLYHNFSISNLTIETNSTGNTVNLKLRWDDGAVGQTHGIGSFQFEVTSSYVTITDVQLHSSLASNFFLRKFAIANGFRVLIYGQSSSKMLKDKGNEEAAYLTAQVIFNAPSSEGSGTMTLTNTDAVRRITTSPYTPSAQSFANATDQLTISTATSVADEVPVFTPGGGYGTAQRKYGDINWDGYIDISDITSLADIVNKNYSNVIVNDATFNFDPPAGTNNRYFYQSSSSESPIDYDNSEDPDKADAVAADVYRAGSDPVPPTNEPTINGMDLSILMDAVLNGFWPSISIPAISNKAAYKNIDENSSNLFVISTDQNRLLERTEDIFIDYEIFNEGKINSRIRINLTNKSQTLRGLQINLNLDKSYLPLNYKIYALRSAEGLNIYWTKKLDNSYSIILLPANEKYLPIMSGSPILTIELPYFKTELVNIEKSFILTSNNNITLLSSYEFKTAQPYNLPAYFELHQNYPNPFNNSTRILVDIPEYSNVKISVFDMLGREVAELANGIFDPGRHYIDWNATNKFGEILSSGNYILLFNATSLDNGAKYKISRKVVFLK